MSDSALIGKVLDNYRIVEEIGEGGMGIVYKAIHTKLDKVVALKMIAPALATSAKFIRRFQTEAKALAKVQDPHIVAIHDLRSNEKQWFIAMEYVEGRDLFDIVANQGALSWKESLYIVKQILSAVGHAHQAGIIHRDLKPHNIMLTKGKQVKITDFGLAKDESNRMQTMTVSAGGTLNYMSPEHVRGFSYIEKRSDLYCVGIILYEMVTGEVPLKDLNSDFDIRESILKKDFDTPAKINKKIPPELESIIMKSIEKHPEDRFQSAEEMLDAIEDFEKGKKIIYRKRKRAGKSKSRSLKIFLPLIITILVLAAAYYSGYFTPFINEQFQQAEILPEISVQTDPPNANIFLNNSLLGKTPLAKHTLQEGNYDLKLELKDYSTIDTTIVVQKDKNLTLNFNLSPDIKEEKIEVANAVKEPVQKTTTKTKELAKLSINSNPSGADVFVNNQPRGKTPLNLNELSSGAYEIKIKQNGYQEYAKQLRLQSNDNEYITADLLKNTGILTINTIPNNVSLSVNGKTQTITGGNIRLTDIPLGKAKIKISKTGYKDYINEAEIQRDRETTINVNLAQLMGKLIVKMRPWGNVYLNNQIQEKITDTKFENELGVNTYNLKVEHPTLGYWQKDIPISDGKETEIVVNFTKKIPVTISAFNESGEPFAGNIIIDGKSTGKSTPQDIKLGVGNHTITVEKPGFTLLEGKREILIEEDHKDPVVFIFKDSNTVN